MNLNNKQKQFLKGLAHPLKPVVMVGGNGLTEGVLAEIDHALNFHELIKIKVSAEDRDTKKLIINAIVAESKSFLVQSIGNILTIYRPTEDKRISLPRG
ncbi:ribosome assembly RNA-binding protein YhbY [Thorsellia kenyensis]|uniref:Ribosome assembly RNA-binding protein YhbY n=1 Tax=Thorsellia kenyensis TaxID=1549888 RepID=A0ABV6CB62_9GAMM